MAAAGELRDLMTVHYEMLVVDQCGLVSDSVVAGYQAEYAAVVARDHLDEAQQRQERHDALVAFDAEYHNRGLGGSRAWCRDEGVPSAEHFAAYAGKEG